ncbi:MAG TPA: hypothetical protein V6D29_11210 [Leptolyngbyaceae cyanobacterium]
MSEELEQQGYSLQASYEFEAPEDSFRAMRSVISGLDNLESKTKSTAKSLKQSGIGTGLASAVQQATVPLNTATRRVDSFAQNAKMLRTELNPLKQQLKAIRAEARNIDFGDVMDERKLRSATRELRVYIKELQGIEKQVGHNTTVEREFTATLKNQERALKQRIELAEAQRQSMLSAQRLGGATLVRDTGRQTLDMFAPSIASAKELQKELGSIKKLAGDSLEQEGGWSSDTAGLKDIQKTILSLSAQMGVVDEQVAEVFENLAGSGKSFSKDQIQLRKDEAYQILENAKALDISNDAATALNITAGSIYKNSLQAYGGMAVLNKRLGSTINVLADKLEDVKISAEDVIPVMRVVMNTLGDSSNFNPAQIAAYSAAISSLGTIEPEAAGSFFNRWSKAMTSNAAGFAKELGYANEAVFEETLNTDKFSVLLKMVEKYKNLEGGELAKGGFLGSLGIKSVQDQKLIQGLASQYEVLGTAEKYATKAFSEGISTSEEFGNVQKTAAFRMERVTQATKALGDAFGMAFLDVINPALDIAGKFLVQLVNLTNRFPILTKAIAVFVIGGAALAVALGTVAAGYFAIQQSAAIATMAMATFNKTGAVPMNGFYKTAIEAAEKKPFFAIADGIKGIGLATKGFFLSPVGLGIVAIGALTIGLIALAKSPAAAEFKKKWSEAFTWISESVGRLMQFIGGIGDKIASVLGRKKKGDLTSSLGLGGADQQIASNLSGQISKIDTGSLLSSLGVGSSGVLALAKTLSDAASGIQAKWERAFGWISGLVSSFLEFAREIGRKLVSALAENSPGPIRTIRDRWETFGAWIVEKWQSFVEAARSVGGLIAKAFVPDRSKLVGAIIETGSIVAISFLTAALTPMTGFGALIVGTISVGLGERLSRALSGAIKKGIGGQNSSLISGMGAGMGVSLSTSFLSPISKGLDDLKTQWMDLYNWVQAYAEFQYGRLKKLWQSGDLRSAIADAAIFSYQAFLEAAKAISRIAIGGVIKTFVSAGDEIEGMFRTLQLDQFLAPLLGLSLDPLVENVIGAIEQIQERLIIWPKMAGNILEGLLGEGSTAKISGYLEGITEIGLFLGTRVFPLLTSELEPLLQGFGKNAAIQAFGKALGAVLGPLGMLLAAKDAMHTLSRTISWIASLNEHKILLVLGAIRLGIMGIAYALTGSFKLTPLGIAVSALLSIYSLVEALTPNVNIFRAGAEKVVPVINAIAGALDGLVNWSSSIIKDVFTANFAKAAKDIQAPWLYAIGAIQTAFAYFTGAAKSKTGPELVTALAGVANSGPAMQFRAQWSDAIGFLQRKFDQFKEFAGQVGDSIGYAFGHPGEMLGNAVDAIKGMSLDAVTGLMTQLKDQIVSYGRNVIANLGVLGAIALAGSALAIFGLLPFTTFAIPLVVRAAIQASPLLIAALASAGIFKKMEGKIREVFSNAMTSVFGDKEWVHRVDDVLDYLGQKINDFWTWVSNIFPEGGILAIASGSLYYVGVALNSINTAVQELGGWIASLKFSLEFLKTGFGQFMGILGSGAKFVKDFGLGISKYIAPALGSMSKLLSPLIEALQSLSGFTLSLPPVQAALAQIEAAIGRLMAAPLIQPLLKLGGQAIAQFAMAAALGGKLARGTGAAVVGGAIAVKKKADEYAPIIAAKLDSAIELLLLINQGVWAGVGSTVKAIGKLPWYLRFFQGVFGKIFGALNPLGFLERAALKATKPVAFDFFLNPVMKKVKAKQLLEKTPAYQMLPDEFKGDMLKDTVAQMKLFNGVLGVWSRGPLATGLLAARLEFFAFTLGGVALALVGAAAAFYVLNPEGFKSTAAAIKTLGGALVGLLYIVTHLGRKVAPTFDEAGNAIYEFEILGLKLRAGKWAATVTKGLNLVIGAVKILAEITVFTIDLFTNVLPGVLIRGLGLFVYGVAWATKQVLVGLQMFLGRVIDGTKELGDAIVLVWTKNDWSGMRKIFWDELLKPIGTTIGRWAKTAFFATLNWIGKAWNDTWNWVGKKFNQFINWAFSSWDWLWTGTISNLKKGANAVVYFFTHPIDILVKALEYVGIAFAAAFSVSWIVKAIQAVGFAVTSTVGLVVGSIALLVSEYQRGFPIITKLIFALNNPIESLNNLMDRLSGLVEKPFRPLDSLLKGITEGIGGWAKKILPAAAIGFIAFRFITKGVFGGIIQLIKDTIGMFVGLITSIGRAADAMINFGRSSRESYESYDGLIGKGRRGRLGMRLDLAPAEQDPIQTIQSGKLPKFGKLSAQPDQVQQKVAEMALEQQAIAKLMAMLRKDVNMKGYEDFYADIGTIGGRTYETQRGRFGFGKRLTPEGLSAVHKLVNESELEYYTDSDYGKELLRWKAKKAGLETMYGSPVDDGSLANIARMVFGDQRERAFARQELSEYSKLDLDAVREVVIKASSVKVEGDSPTVSSARTLRNRDDVMSIPANGDFLRTAAGSRPAGLVSQQNFEKALENLKNIGVKKLGDAPEELLADIAKAVGVHSSEIKTHAPSASQVGASNKSFLILRTLQKLGKIPESVATYGTDEINKNLTAIAVEELISINRSNSNKRRNKPEEASAIASSELQAAAYARTALKNKFEFLDEAALDAVVKELQDATSGVVDNHKLKTNPINNAIAKIAKAQIEGMLSGNPTLILDAVEEATAKAKKELPTASAFQQLRGSFSESIHDFFDNIFQSVKSFGQPTIGEMEALRKNKLTELGESMHKKGLINKSSQELPILTSSASFALLRAAGIPMRDGASKIDEIKYLAKQQGQGTELVSSIVRGITTRSTKDIGAGKVLTDDVEAFIRTQMGGVSDKEFESLIDRIKQGNIPGIKEKLPNGFGGKGRKNRGALSDALKDWLVNEVRIDQFVPGVREYNELMSKYKTSIAAIQAGNTSFIDSNPELKKFVHQEATRSKKQDDIEGFLKGRFQYAGDHDVFEFMQRGGLVTELNDSNIEQFLQKAGMERLGQGTMAKTSISTLFSGKYDGNNINPSVASSLRRVAAFSDVQVDELIDPRIGFKELRKARQLRLKKLQKMLQVQTAEAAAEKLGVQSDVLNDLLSGKFWRLDDQQGLLDEIARSKMGIAGGGAQLEKMLSTRTLLKEYNGFGRKFVRLVFAPPKAMLSVLGITGLAQQKLFSMQMKSTLKGIEKEKTNEDKLAEATRAQAIEKRALGVQQAMLNVRKKPKDIQAELEKSGLNSVFDEYIKTGRWISAVSDKNRNEISTAFKGKGNFEKFAKKLSENKLTSEFSSFLETNTWSDDPEMLTKMGRLMRESGLDMAKSDSLRNSILDRGILDIVQGYLKDATWVQQVSAEQKKEIAGILGLTTSGLENIDSKAPKTKIDKLALQVRAFFLDIEGSMDRFVAGLEKIPVLGGLTKKALPAAKRFATKATDAGKATKAAFLGAPGVSHFNEMRAEYDKIRGKSLQGMLEKAGFGSVNEFGGELIDRLKGQNLDGKVARNELRAILQPNKDGLKSGLTNQELQNRKMTLDAIREMLNLSEQQMQKFEKGKYSTEAVEPFAAFIGKRFPKLLAKTMGSIMLGTLHNFYKVSKWGTGWLLKFVGKKIAPSLSRTVQEFGHSLGDAVFFMRRFMPGNTALKKLEANMRNWGQRNAKWVLEKAGIAEDAVRDMAKGDGIGGAFGMIRSAYNMMLGILTGDAEAAQSEANKTGIRGVISRIFGAIGKSFNFVTEKLSTQASRVLRSLTRGLSDTVHGQPIDGGPMGRGIFRGMQGRFTAKRSTYPPYAPSKPKRNAYTDATHEPIYDPSRLLAPGAPAEKLTPKSLLRGAIRRAGMGLQGLGESIPYHKPKMFVVERNIPKYIHSVDDKGEITMQPIKGKRDVVDEWMQPWHDRQIANITDFAKRTIIGNGRGITGISDKLQNGRNGLGIIPDAIAATRDSLAEEMKFQNQKKNAPPAGLTPEELKKFKAEQEALQQKRQERRQKIMAKTGISGAINLGRNVRAGLDGFLGQRKAESTRKGGFKLVEGDQVPAKRKGPNIPGPIKAVGDFYAEGMMWRFKNSLFGEMAAKAGESFRDMAREIQRNMRTVENNAQATSVALWEKMSRAARRTSDAWSQTKNGVSLTWAQMVERADRIRTALVNRLNHGAADVTAAAWERTEGTFDSVTDQMVHDSKLAGEQIAQNMEHATDEIVQHSKKAGEQLAQNLNPKRKGGGLGRAFGGLGKAGGGLFGTAGAIGGGLMAAGFASQGIAYSLQNLGFVDEKTGEKINKLTELFSLVSSIGGVILPLFGAIASTVGGVISVVVGLGTAIVGIGAAIFTFIFSPLGLATAAIIGSVLLINEILKRTFGIDVIGPIFGGFAAQAGAAAGAVTGAFTFAANWVTGAWEGFRDKFWPILQPIVQPALDVAQQLINALNHNPTVRIPEAWYGAVERITAYLQSLPIIGQLVSGDLIKIFDPNRIFGFLGSAWESISGLFGKKVKNPFVQEKAPEEVVLSDVTKILDETRRQSQKMGETQETIANIASMQGQSFMSPTGKNMMTAGDLSKAIAGDASVYSDATVAAYMRAATAKFALSGGKEMGMSGLGDQRRLAEAKQALTLSKANTFRERAAAQQAAAAELGTVRLSDKRRSMLVQMGLDPDAVEAGLNAVKKPLTQFGQTWQDRMSAIKRSGGDFWGTIATDMQEVKKNFLGLHKDFIGSALQIAVSFGLMTISAIAFGVSSILSMGPVALIMGGIALAAVAVAFNFLGLRTAAVIVWQTVSGLVGVVRDVVGGIVQIARGLGNIFKGARAAFNGDFKPVMEGVEQALQGIKQTARSVGRGIVIALSGAARAAAAPFVWLGSAIANSSETAKNAWEGFLSLLNRIKAKVTSIKEAVEGSAVGRMARAVTLKATGKAGTMASARDIVDFDERAAGRIPGPTIGDRFRSMFRRKPTAEVQAPTAQAATQAAAAPVATAPAAASARPRFFGRRPKGATEAAATQSTPKPVVDIDDGLEMSRSEKANAALNSVAMGVGAIAPALAAPLYTISAISDSVVGLGSLFPKLGETVKNSFGQMGGAIASKFMPVLGSLWKTIFTNFLPGIVAMITGNFSLSASFAFVGAAAGTAWTLITGPLLPIIAGIALLTVGVIALFKLFWNVGGILKGVFRNIKLVFSTFQQVFESIGRGIRFSFVEELGNIGRDLRSLGAILIAPFMPLINLLGLNNNGGRSPFTQGIALAVNILTIPLKLVALAVIGVIKGLSLVIRSVLFVAKIAATVLVAPFALIGHLLAGIAKFIGVIIKGTVAPFLNFFSSIRSFFGMITGAGIDPGKGYAARGGKGFSPIGFLVDGVKNSLGTITGAFQGFFGVINAIWSSSFGKIFGVLGQEFGKIWEQIKSIGAVLLEPLKPITEMFGKGGSGGGLTKGIKIVAQALMIPVRLLTMFAVNLIKSFSLVIQVLLFVTKILVKGIVDPITAIVKGVLMAGQAVRDAFLAPFMMIWSFGTRLVEMFQNLGQAIQSNLPGPMKWMFGGGGKDKGKEGGRKKIGYATGGLVRGPGTSTSDSVLAPWLSNGEFVMPALATARNMSVLEMMRSGMDVQSMLKMLPVAPPPVPGELLQPRPTAVAEAPSQRPIQINITFGDVVLSGGSGKEQAQEFMNAVNPDIQRAVKEALRDLLEKTR